MSIEKIQVGKGRGFFLSALFYDSAVNVHKRLTRNDYIIYILVIITNQQKRLQQLAFCLNYSKQKWVLLLFNGTNKSFGRNAGDHQFITTQMWVCNYMIAISLGLIILLSEKTQCQVDRTLRWWSLFIFLWQPLRYVFLLHYAWLQRDPIILYCTP